MDRVIELKAEVFDILVEIERLNSIKNNKLNEMASLLKEEKNESDIR
jgi:hypothetical protein